METERDVLTREVAAVQAAVETALLMQAAPGQPHHITDRNDAVIRQVRGSEQKDLAPFLGDLMSNRLKTFCDLVDLDHPAIQPVMAEGFRAGSEFCDTLAEMLSFAGQGGQQLPHVVKLLQEGFMRLKTGRSVRAAVYKPPIRTLASQASRDAARAKKATKEVSLTEWLEKPPAWAAHPGSFAAFTRLNDSHVAASVANAAKSSAVAGLGMPALAGSFRQRNQIIEAFLGEQYYGFTKIKMVDAAIILAKMHNATYRDGQCITCPRAAIQNGPFWLEPDHVYVKLTNFCADAEKNQKRQVTVKTCMIPDVFGYKPRAYPLHEFKVDAPRHVRDVISIVESHSDVLGKALFDQFWVVCPGLNLAAEMHNYANRWLIRMEDDRLELYDSAAEAERALDFRLTAVGDLVPALLGEADGKCFFLSLWR